MSEKPTDHKIELVLKLNEAESYYSMGLFAESLGIYEQILSDMPDLPAHSQEKVREKMNRLTREIAYVEKEASRKVSPEDLSFIKETLDIDGDVSAVLDSANSFKELGLFNEASSEYEKLLQQGYSSSEIIPQLAECYLMIYPQAKLIDEIERLIDQVEWSRQEKAASMFLFAVEMEKQDHNSLAVDLYRSAKEMNPEDEEIKTVLDTKIANLSSGSKYDYILNQGIITEEQLQEALALSEKTKKSVELILFESFEIKKDEIGKSASFFYGCPFRLYDPDLPTPVKLIRNLSESFLLNDVWVPLSWDRKGIEILIDDPKDANKTNRIKSLLNTERIIFSVGIKEDIEAFIKRFFETIKSDESVSREEMVEGAGLIPDVLSELEELGREERKQPILPEFVYVEFNLGETPEKQQTYRLNVVDYSRHGFGLLVTDKDLELLPMLNPGDSIKDITFYATWTLIKVDATVRHISKIEESRYIIGVESSEIIESSELI